MGVVWSEGGWVGGISKGRGERAHRVMIFLVIFSSHNKLGHPWQYLPSHLDFTHARASSQDVASAAAAAAHTHSASLPTLPQSSPRHRPITALILTWTKPLARLLPVLSGAAGPTKACTHERLAVHPTQAATSRVSRMLLLAVGWWRVEVGRWRRLLSLLPALGQGVDGGGIEVPAICV